MSDMHESSIDRRLAREMRSAGHAERRPPSAWLLAVLACAVALLAGAPAAPVQSSYADASMSGTPQGSSSYSATVEQCTTSAVQAERSATFTGQMLATAATQRMGMRIDLQQRLRGALAFHTVVAPEFQVWRGSETGVKIYRYMKQVTSLAAPAVYRAVVRFRWLDARGRVIRHAEARTTRCEEPLLVAPTPGA